MAERRESTNERIVRLFKEGLPVDKIAEQETLPVDNVKGIIEKRVPDYANYKPAENKPTASKEEPAQAAPAEKSTEKSTWSLFGIRKKSKITNMGKDGFTNEQASKAADMLTDGKPYDQIMNALKISEIDVKEIDELKAEHYRRQKFTKQPASSTTPVPEKTDTHPKTTNIAAQSKQTNETEHVTMPSHLHVSESFLANVTKLEDQKEKTISNKIDNETEQTDKNTVSEKDKNIGTKSTRAQDKLAEFIKMQLDECSEELDRIDSEILIKEKEKEDSAKLVNDAQNQYTIAYDAFVSAKSHYDSSKAKYDSICDELTMLKNSRSEIEEDINTFKETTIKA